MSMMLPEHGLGWGFLWVVLACLLCKITHMKSAEIIKRLQADGWKQVHVVGSHHQSSFATPPSRAR